MHNAKTICSIYFSSLPWTKNVENYCSRLPVVELVHIMGGASPWEQEEKEEKEEEEEDDEEIE